MAFEILVDCILTYFSSFSGQIGFDISYELFPMETILIKC